MSCNLSKDEINAARSEVPTDNRELAPEAARNESIRVHQLKNKPKPQSILVDKDGNVITNSCCWQGKKLPPITEQH
jgi:hypothetical protein